MNKMNIIKKAAIVGGLSMAAFTFAGCGNSAVVGAWEMQANGQTGTMVFQNDGKISVFDDYGNTLSSYIDCDMSYKAFGNTVTVIMDYNGVTYETNGTVNGNSMVLSNEYDTMYLTRK